MAYATKSIGLEPVTEMPLQVNFYQFHGDDKAGILVVAYEIVRLAPNGAIVDVVKSGNYVRQDKPAVYYQPGDVITPAEYYKAGDQYTQINQQGTTVTLTAIGGELKAPAVIATGTEVKTPADPAYTNFKASSEGQALLALLVNDVNLVQSLGTIDTDLAQK